jgi:hypothetical protein
MISSSFVCFYTPTQALFARLDCISDALASASAGSALPPAIVRLCLRLCGLDVRAADSV